MRKTKIICTIGPASESEEMLRELILAGMNVARFNFSHGTHEEHEAKFLRLKKVRIAMNVPVAALLDTKGPEIRTGNFLNGEEMLVDGQKFTLTTEACEGTLEKVSVTYKNLPKEVARGNLVLINDGKIVITNRYDQDSNPVSEN